MFDFTASVCGSSPLHVTVNVLHIQINYNDETDVVFEAAAPLQMNT